MTTLRPFGAAWGHLLGRRPAVAAVALAYGLLGCHSEKPTTRPNEAPQAVSSGVRLEPPAEMPGAAAFVLGRPERFEIFTVTPAPLSAEDRAKDGPTRFHGYAIVGRAEVADVSTRERVVATVYEGIRSNDGSIAACFNPRHGIRATREGKTVDLLICYECHQVQVHVPGENEQTLLTSAKVEAEINGLFGAAGLRPPP